VAARLMPIDERTLRCVSLRARRSSARRIDPLVGFRSLRSRPPIQRMKRTLASARSLSAAPLGSQLAFY